MRTVSQEYTFAIDNIEEPEWSELLRQFDDATFYQTMGYGEIQYGSQRLTHVVVRRNHQVVAAIQGQVLRIPGLKIGIAHFPWGPMWRTQGHPENTEHLRQILRCILHHYARGQGLLVRVRSYEVDDEHSRDTIFSVFEQEGFQRSDKDHYETVRVDLQRELTDLRSKMSSQWRRHLRAAEQRDFSILQGDTPDLFRAFTDLYHEMYSRKQIVGYNPDVDRYRDVQENLCDHLKFVVLLCKYEGEAVAANVVSALGDTGMYVFGATSDRAISENLRASYLLHWRTIQWLKERGFRWYDMRGYDPERHPGISQFKAGLNGGIIKFAEFIGCHNPVSLATVKLGEGLLASLNATKDRLKSMRSRARRSR